MTYAKVFKRGDTWYMEAYDSTGKCVIADNTGSLPIIGDLARHAVDVIETVELWGHAFKKDWQTLVAEAGGNL